MHGVVWCDVSDPMHQPCSWHRIPLSEAASPWHNPSIHPSLFLLVLALKSCVSLALSKGGYFHPASPPQQCSTTSPLLSLSLTGHHRVHCISCLVRPPGWMISGPVGTRSGHRPSAPVASDSRALNLQIMLTINNAPPSLLRSIRSRGAFYRTPVWIRAATKRSGCWRGNKACACLGRFAIASLWCA